MFRLNRSGNATALLLRILFKLRERGIHFVPWVRVTGPHVHLRFEPARIIQAGGSDGNELRNGIWLDYYRRAAVRAKAPTSLAACLAGRGMKARRALQKLEGFSRHDDEGRVRSTAGSLAIATMAVEHQNRFGFGFVANPTTGASA